MQKCDLHQTYGLFTRDNAMNSAGFDETGLWHDVSQAQSTIFLFFRQEVAMTHVSQACPCHTTMGPFREIFVKYLSEFV